MPVDSVRIALYGWQREVKAKHWPRSMWGPQAILDDNTCELLASIALVKSKAFLSLALKASWVWWDKLGAELFFCVISTFLPSLKLPKAPNDLQQLRTATDSASTSAQTAPAGSRTQRARALPPLEFAPTLYDSFWSSFKTT
jgi:hypothetical protein